MNPQEEQNSSQNVGNGQSTIPNPLSAMQPEEQIVCEIKRHPIGIFIVFGISGLVIILLAIFAFVVVPGGTTSSSARIGAGLAFLLITVGSMLFAFVANIIYWGNHWVVTTDSITQMQQTSLFNRESSQLSLGNLEDMAAEKKGVLATIFNFGILKAETAGEREKFLLAYCPRPEFYAQKILMAREAFEQAHHGGKQEPNPAYKKVDDQEKSLQLGQTALADVQKSDLGQDTNLPRV